MKEKLKQFTIKESISMRKYCEAEKWRSHLKIQIQSFVSCIASCYYTLIFIPYNRITGDTTTSLVFSPCEKKGFCSEVSTTKNIHWLEGSFNIDADAYECTEAAISSKFSEQ